MPRPLYARGRDPVPLVQETGRIYVSIVMGVENPARSAPRYPTILARSVSPYRLSYPGRQAVQEVPSFYQAESS